MNFKRFTTGKVVLVALVLSACATAAYQPIKAGLLEYGGSQKTIFEKGKAEPVVPLAAMSGAADLYAVGAVSASTARSPSSRAGPTSPRCVARVTPPNTT